MLLRREFITITYAKEGSVSMPKDGADLITQYNHISQDKHDGE
jgi:hypothetical protein